jgi:hypothetical protein
MFVILCVASLEVAGVWSVAKVVDGRAMGVMGREKLEASLVRAWSLVGGWRLLKGCEVAGVATSGINGIEEAILAC